MLRPVAGLFFVLCTCYGALTDRNEFPRDRLEGNGNEPSIEIDKIIGGNYSDGSFSIGYGINNSNKRPGNGKGPRIPEGIEFSIDQGPGPETDFSGDRNDVDEDVSTTKSPVHKKKKTVADSSSASRIRSLILTIFMPVISFFKRLF